MKKQYVNHDQLTQASEALRAELVSFCKENAIYTWKQTPKGEMERVEPDEYNLPLFNYGQLLSFLLPKLEGLHLEVVARELADTSSETVITSVLFKDKKFGLINGALTLGSDILSFEPIDALWGVLLHYGTEISIKSPEGKENGKNS